MISKRTRLQVLAFLVIALLSTTYLGFRYVGLDQLFLGTGYTVKADFTDSGGIFVNAEVTYRGVSVGRVTDMRLLPHGVEVDLTMKPGQKPIPASAHAAVVNRSAVGEQYVDLTPPDDSPPYLKENSLIPVEHTSIPIPVTQLLLDTDELARSLNLDHLRTLVSELGKGFSGTGDDLARLIDNGDLLLQRAQASLPQTQRLITDGQVVLSTQEASASAIQQWAHDLHLLTTTLVQADPDIRSLLQSAPDAAAALQALVQDAGPSLGPLVKNLDILNGVTIPRLPGLEQILVTYPDVVSGGFSVVRNEGGVMRAHFGLVTSNSPRACTSGYLSTASTPTPSAVARADTSQVACAVKNGVDPNPSDGVDESGSNIRGAQNINSSGGSAASPTPAPPALPSSQILGRILNATPFSTSG